MSRTSAFMEFVKREIDGTIREDASYRAYDLDRLTGTAALNRALRYVGYGGRIDELRSDLAGIGYRGDLRGPLIRWYVWHRLSTGDLLKWPLRNKSETDDENKPRNRFNGPGRPRRNDRAAQGLMTPERPISLRGGAVAKPKMRT